MKQETYYDLQAATLIANVNSNLAQSAQEKLNLLEQGIKDVKSKLKAAPNAAELLKNKATYEENAKLLKEIVDKSRDKANKAIKMREKIEDETL